MTKALKIIALIVGVLLLFSVVHTVSHKIGMKPHVKMQANHIGKGGPSFRKGKSVARDKNRNIVRHGFLQHHIHDGSGNVLWQKPSDPELVVQPESE
jgi:hypothetical protein